MAKRTGKKKPKKSNIVRIVLLAVAALILGVSVYDLNAKSLTGNQMPMPFGIGCSVVLTGSMEDRLSVNDLIIVKAASDYEVDDIVVYQDGKSLVVHRIIAIDEDTVTTKGDANNTADAPISKGQIKGVLICDIGGVGALVNAIKHPISIFVILAAVLLLTELSFRKEKDKDTDELTELMERIKALKENYPSGSPGGEPPPLTRGGKAPSDEGAVSEAD